MQFIYQWNIRGNMIQISNKNIMLTTVILLMIGLICFISYEITKKSGVVDIDYITRLAENGNAEAQTDRQTRA